MSYFFVPLSSLSAYSQAPIKYLENHLEILIHDNHLTNIYPHNRALRAYDKWM